MRPFCKLLCMLAVGLVVSTLCPATLSAQGPYLYMMSSSACSDGYPCVAKMDIPSGVIVAWYTGLSQNGVDEGRGVAVVGNLMYWTTALSGYVNVYDLNARKWLYRFQASAGSGLSSLATDGKTLWVQEYAISFNGNTVYLFDISQAFPKYVGFIHSLNCTKACDGLEVFADSSGQKRLLVNTGDAQPPYSEYTLNGGWPIGYQYLTPPTHDTGIAWDGTNFYTSYILGNSIHVLSFTSLWSNERISANPSAIALGRETAATSLSNLGLLLLRFDLRVAGGQRAAGARVQFCEFAKV